METNINGNNIRIAINAFKPILVTADDGNKYNVIPSDQFK